LTADFVVSSFQSLKMLADDRYDVMITDPPYSEHVHANLCSGSVVGTKRVPKYELKFDPLKSWEWLHDALRVTRRWVVTFCTLEDFGLIEAAVGRPAYVRACIWYKPNSMGQLTRDRPAQATEGIALLHGNAVKKRWNGAGSYGIWKCEELPAVFECNGTRGVPDRHPNQKPEDLALKLAALFSERGETIFDPFCGSGALLHAAQRLGRNVYGWDNDPHWAGYAKESLAHPELLVLMTDIEAMNLCPMRDGAKISDPTHRHKTRKKKETPYDLGSK
jgi:site-specific DNA-methyltransferase (adenine-specific)